MATAVRKKRPSSFGRLLRTELDGQGVSTRELARRIAPAPEKVEGKRRLLHQYLCGDVSPGPEMRLLIAEALSIDPSVFTEDAEREADREQLLDALEPLADILLTLATKAHG